MSYEIKQTSQFRKDVKQALRRGYDIEKLLAVVAMLKDGIPMPQEYRDHALTGNFRGYRECHIEADWLLVYRKSEQYLILTLFRTGTHSDIF
ncbi:MAG: type II toxin-antitoxin system YafQ family toxin [Victivallales bacterium]|nr:type II toxin-antitoxin system YafQ family toxin [Victivallales bacterium]